MIHCRGSVILGSACLACPRCAKEQWKLLESLVDDEPCSYDHHGYCQTHFLHAKPCPYEVVQTLKKNKASR